MGGRNEQRITGLLFADDLICLSPTRRKVVKVHRRLDEWLKLNEMSVGIRKSGIMVVVKPWWWGDLEKER